MTELCTGFSIGFRTCDRNEADWSRPWLIRLDETAKPRAADLEFGAFPIPVYSRLGLAGAGSFEVLALDPVLPQWLPRANQRESAYRRTIGGTVEAIRNTTCWQSVER